jgi:peroxiredoxin (alkyl hydroperoxide reductase subunit C)
MAELKDGCVKPAKGPILDPQATEVRPTALTMEVPSMQARVGQEAPDFEATAFIRDKGFAPVRLSDYKGQWIVVCFYPGDFTFV